MHDQKPTTIDYNKLKPYFGWSMLKTIKKNFENSTQWSKFYCVTHDISILMMYAFYQSVYCVSHNGSFLSTSEEKLAFWVGFGEPVDDAITHKLLDSSSNKILYRTTVHPAV